MSTISNTLNNLSSNLANYSESAWSMLLTEAATDIAGLTQFFTLGEKKVSILKNNFSYISASTQVVNNQSTPSDFEGRVDFTYYSTKDKPTQKRESKPLLVDPSTDKREDIKDNFKPLTQDGNTNISYEAKDGIKTNFTYAEHQNDSQPMSGEVGTVVAPLEFVKYATISNVEPNTLVGKTNRWFKSQTKDAKDDYISKRFKTVISRFHTSFDESDKEEIENSVANTAYSKTYGLSHGRNLLKTDIDPTKPYDNPYCRVWTYHHQYNKFVTDTMRPFRDNNLAELDDSNYYWQVFRSTKYGTNFKSGGKRLQDYGVMFDNDGHTTGLINITPKWGNNNGVHTKGKGGVSLKHCMFSIENLAWKGMFNNYAGDMEEFGLSNEQKGPFGGRIMWFPPYDLKFSESSDANWNETTFIGRGEPMYTYSNTTRSGQLSFKLLIDHPAILDYWEKRNDTGNIDQSTVDDITSKEQMLLRFFAGCEILKAAEPTKEPVITPTPTPTPKPKSPDKIFQFFVFYPNNYSGKDDKINSPVDPIHYLMGGVGAQKIYDPSGDTTTLTNGIDGVVDKPIELLTPIMYNGVQYGGYEIRDGKGISIVTAETNTNAICNIEDGPTPEPVTSTEFTVSNYKSKLQDIINEYKDSGNGEYLGLAYNYDSQSNIIKTTMIHDDLEDSEEEGSIIYYDGSNFVGLTNEEGFINTLNLYTSENIAVIILDGKYYFADARTLNACDLKYKEASSGSEFTVENYEEKIKAIVDTYTNNGYGSILGEMATNYTAYNGKFADYAIKNTSGNLILWGGSDSKYTPIEGLHDKSDENEFIEAINKIGSTNLAVVILPSYETCIFCDAYELNAFPLITLDGNQIILPAQPKIEQVINEEKTINLPCNEDVASVTESATTKVGTLMKMMSVKTYKTKKKCESGWSTKKKKAWHKKRYYYRADKDTLDQILVGDKNNGAVSYIDKTSYGLNSTGCTRAWDYWGIKDKANTYSLAEMFTVLENDYASYSTEFCDSQRLEALKEIIEKNKDRITEVTFKGRASSQANNAVEKVNIKRNKTLSKNRAATVRNWLKKWLGIDSSKFKEIKFTLDTTRNGEQKDSNDLDAKLNRFCLVEIHYSVEDTEDMDKAQIEVTNAIVSGDGVTMTEEEVKASGALVLETIKKGSKGDLVKKLQTALGITSDGIFGDDTKNALITFQKSKSLTADGICGPKTWSALGIEGVYKQGVAANNSLSQSNTTNTNVLDEVVVTGSKSANSSSNQKEATVESTKAKETAQNNNTYKSQNSGYKSKRYDDEAKFFNQIKDNEPFFYKLLSERIKFFNPAFHSMSPEGFNARLTFLQQCMRQGPTLSSCESNDKNANNLAFGRPPVCILRIGDFYYSKIIIQSLNITYDPLVWDLNEEGIGAMPMIADVSLGFQFIGGSEMSGPIQRLQNAISFNYYANTSIYDNRAEEIEFEDFSQGKVSAFKPYYGPTTDF